jgi:hypothetical protein
MGYNNEITLRVDCRTNCKSPLRLKIKEKFVRVHIDSIARAFSWQGLTLIFKTPLRLKK